MSKWRRAVRMRSCRVGGVHGLPSRAARISANTQGSPCAARPTITCAQPVSSSMRLASAPVRTSPLPSTGMSTARTTSAMTRQSARPA